MNNMQKSFKRKSALRCMADGGIFKSTQRVGQDDIQVFSDDPNSGALYAPGSPTPAPAPPQTIGPPSSLAPPPLPVPPPAAKISPLAIGPKSDLMAKTGGFGPTPAPPPNPNSTYMKAGGTGGIPSVQSAFGQQPGASRYASSPGSDIGANRAEIGANRPPIGAPRMGALGRPIMTSVGYARGGKVTGPGGPTEDKIPAMLSDGEYVLPADTVKQVGVQNLDALKDATHTPARGKSSLRNGVMHLAGGSTRNYMPLPEQNQTAPAVWPLRDSLGLATPPARLDNVVQKPVAPLDQRLPKIADTYPNGSPVGVSVKSVSAAQLPSQAEAAKMVAQQTGYNPTLAMVETGTPSQQPMPPRLSSEVLSGMTNVGVMRGIGKPQTPLTDEQQRKRIADGIESAAPIMGPALRQNLESLDSSTGPLELGLRIARGTGQTLLAGGEAALRAAGGALQGDGPSLSEQWHRGLGTTPAPAPTPVPTPAPGAPAPGGTPALPEGVTQRPDGIYQQGNSFTNIVGADGKPQLLQEERMGPPSPAAEAYLARTPEMQFGPIPSGPGSSLRSGRGGGMRLNMPGASSGINARFDKLVSDYTKNANWGLSPSKTARTLAGIEQARTNALNGVMGNDTTRRGQDIDRARTDATNAAGMAQEGLKGQFNLLGETAARNAAAQKAQAERDLEMETGTADRLKALFGEDEGLGAHQAYTANQSLIQSMLTPGADGSINVREQDRMSGALHAVLKAAGKGPNSQIVDIVNTPDNGAEAGPTGSPIFDLTFGDAYAIKFGNGEVARVKQSALKDNPDAESFIQNYQRRKAQQAKGAK